MRDVGLIAKIYGHDVKDPAVQNLMLWCLLHASGVATFGSNVNAASSEQDGTATPSALQTVLSILRVGFLVQLGGYAVSRVVSLINVAALKRKSKLRNPSSRLCDNNLFRNLAAVSKKLWPYQKVALSLLPGGRKLLKRLFLFIFPLCSAKMKLFVV